MENGRRISIHRSPRLNGDSVTTRRLSGKQVTLLLLFLVAMSVLYAFRMAGHLPDFEVYWTAAGRALAAEPLYRASDGHFQFKYLPAFAVVASPVSLLPLEVAKAKWYAISVTMMIGLLALSIRALPERRRPTGFIVTIMVLAMGKFYGHELVLGQVNLLFAVLVVLMILALRAERPAAAAALCVGAVVVKPYAVLFLPWVAWRGGWRAAISATIGMLAVFAAPLGLYGVRGTLDLHLAWWATVTTSTAPNLLNPDNISIAALAAKWLGIGTPASLVAAGISLVLLAVAAVVVFRGGEIPDRETLEGALLLTLVPLLSPQGWDYVFLVATPAIALIANYDRELPSRQRIVTWIAVLTIGLWIYDVVGRTLYRAFMNWSFITLCFFIVIAALTTLRKRRVA